MLFHILGQEESEPGLLGLTAALDLLGHPAAHAVVPGPTVSDAADLGHRLVERPLGAPPDVVLASGWLAGLAAQIATRDTATPVVQRLFAPGRALDHDRRRLEGAIGRSATRLIALCGDDVDRLVGYGVRRSVIRVVPHGVDTAAFQDDGPSWPVADGRRLVARPGDSGAAHQLVSMLPSLPRSELVLLTTPATRPTVSGAVSAVTTRHPVAQRVRLVDLVDLVDLGEPRVDQQDSEPAAALPALLRSADVVVTTGDDEPELDLALQAMACGLPVVARATGAMALVVADGVTGVLVPGSWPESLGDAVRGLLADDLRRETYGFAAGDRARASFGWRSVAATVARVAAEATGDDALMTDVLA